MRRTRGSRVFKGNVYAAQRERQAAMHSRHFGLSSAAISSRCGRTRFQPAIRRQHGGRESDNMQVQQRVKHAMDLANFLKSTGHEVTLVSGLSNEVFIKVYKDFLRAGSGVYLFCFDDGEVFYIGKTEAKRSDFARIWRHLATTAKPLDSSGRLGFPESKFLADFDAGSSEYEAIRTGHFRIHYLA